ncbi:MAG: hypothetical protein ACTSV7_09055 [Candidatus Baldrarchaeia archaeon]
MTYYKIYEFWSGDDATDIVRDMLKDYGIPFKERVVKRKRYETEADEWAILYVDAKDLINWLRERVEKEIEKSL